MGSVDQWGIENQGRIAFLPRRRSPNSSSARDFCLWRPTQLKKDSALPAMAGKAESFFSWVGRQRQKSRAELEFGLRRRGRKAIRPWFSIPHWSTLPIYTTYLPDSLYLGRQDGAFNSLVKRFCARNPDNGGDLPR